MALPGEKQRKRTQMHKQKHFASNLCKDMMVFLKENYKSKKKALRQRRGGGNK